MPSDRDDERNGEKKDDLSSLISLPPAGSEPISSSVDEVPSEPVQFESLEELSQKFEEAPTPPEPTSENAVSGLDMSLLDTPSEEPVGSHTIPPLSPADSPTELDTMGAAPTVATQAPLDSIKSFSETLANTEAQVAAALPFTLRIDGKLTPEEIEKLFTILTREKMGFREVDLEPQVAEGKLLIPRISEYAGILLIQALRGVSAKIQFGPSDEIFSTPETRDDFAAFSTDSPSQWTSQDEAEATRIDNEEIPVSNSEHLPQFQHVRVIDTVIVSGLLTTNSLEASQSNEYTILLEALVRELKFKARRRGANGILSLQITLTPLTLPTDYRVTVVGSAVIGTSN